jgi:hypothetical protein
MRIASIASSLAAIGLGRAIPVSKSSAHRARRRSARSAAGLPGREVRPLSARPLRPRQRRSPEGRREGRRAEEKRASFSAIPSAVLKTGPPLATTKEPTTMNTMKRTERRGISIEDDDFDRGYWARYDNDPFKRRQTSQWRLGWIACDTELREERCVRARIAAMARWQRYSGRRVRAPHVLASAEPGT